MIDTHTAQMNARMAQFAESQSAMEGVISQLERARTLLELIKRREKLKRQIVAVEQARSYLSRRGYGGR